MEWSKGFSATYYAKRVDPESWRDIEMINITGGSIKRESSGLRESADIDCTRYDVAIEQWIRVYLDTEQNGSHEHVALFTGLATSPEEEYDGYRTENALECYSVLKPCDDIILMRGWYAPQYSSSGAIIKKLLSVTPAPVVIAEDAPRLETSIIAEDNETNLTMIERVLTAIDWRIRIDGDGTINVEPKPQSAAVSFDPHENDAIETKIKVSADWYSCPNVFMAVKDDLKAIARDESTSSPLSIVNRGREVWKVETNCDLSEDESIAHYAQRMLYESQRITKTADYDRRYHPGVLPGDLIRLQYPAQGLDDVFVVESQSIELGYGARTSETVSAYITAQTFAEDDTETGFFGLVTDDSYNLITSDGDTLVGLGII